MDESIADAISTGSTAMTTREPGAGSSASTSACYPYLPRLRRSDPSRSSNWSSVCGPEGRAGRLEPPTACSTRTGTTATRHWPRQRRRQTSTQAGRIGSPPEAGTGRVGPVRGSAASGPDQRQRDRPSRTAWVDASQARAIPYRRCGQLPTEPWGLHRHERPGRSGRQRHHRRRQRGCSCPGQSAVARPDARSTQGALLDRAWISDDRARPHQHRQDQHQHDRRGHAAVRLTPLDRPDRRPSSWAPEPPGRVRLADRSAGRSVDFQQTLAELYDVSTSARTPSWSPAAASTPARAPRSMWWRRSPASACRSRSAA